MQKDAVKMLGGRDMTPDIECIVNQFLWIKCQRLLWYPPRYKGKNSPNVKHTSTLLYCALTYELCNIIDLLFSSITSISLSLDLNTAMT